MYEGYCFAVHMSLYCYELHLVVVLTECLAYCYIQGCNCRRMLGLVACRARCGLLFL